MAVRGAQETIAGAVLAWAGVTAYPHRFGGTEFRLGQREVGHIHGDTLLDIPFPRAVRDEVIAAGLASPHHILPDTGWISLSLHTPADVETAVALLRRSYELAQVQQARRVGREDA